MQLGVLLKLWKWHTVVFRCPCCGKDADYAAQVIEGEHTGTYWNPTYWCEKCSSPVRARDTWLFGAVFGPLVAMVATLAWESVPPAWGLPHAAAIAYTAICAGIAAWPLSRTLTRHLLYWEPCDTHALRAARARRLRDDE